jgi:hypothetical protein
MEMATDQALSEEIAKLRKALANVAQLIAAADPDQRQKLEEIRLTLEIALEAAPSSCSCTNSAARTCSLTGIRLEP